MAADAGGVTVRRSLSAYTYDSATGTRAEIMAKDLAHASTVVVTFGMENDALEIAIRISFIEKIIGCVNLSHVPAPFAPNLFCVNQLRRLPRF